MRRHRDTKEEVELNVTAMLDMAFQLLAFFILTYRPSPVEVQLSLNLPPPLPVTNVSPDQPADLAPEGAAVAINSLVIAVRADDRGEVSSVSVGPGRAFEGQATPQKLRELNRQLRALFGFQHTPYDQVLIRVAPGLHYEELMKIIDVCTQQKLPDGSRLQKINFAELSDSGG
jgi:biopolymer transport protein ExbD